MEYLKQNKNYYKIDLNAQKKLKLNNIIKRYQL